MQAELISVVIPTFERPAALDACLTALGAQTVARDGFEIVVVDDGGGRRPYAVDEVVSRHASSLRLRLERAAHAGPATARNAGAALSAGALLAFTDDDCIPDPGWLEAMTRALRRSPGAIVGGRTENSLTRNLCSDASQAVLDYLYAESLSRTGELPFVASNNLALARDVFDELGGFDPSFTWAGGEDRDLSARSRSLGHPLVYEPGALVRHAHPLDLGGLARQYAAYGRGARLLGTGGRDAPDGSPRVRSAGFYAGMLRASFRRLPPRRAAVVALLVALTQLATAVGYAAGSRTGGSGFPPRGPGADRHLSG
jgi:GT2 family glycosyltransferase